MAPFSSEQREPEQQWDNMDQKSNHRKIRKYFEVNENGKITS
jgi:hypothetical protein